MSPEREGIEVVEREFGELALNMGPQHPSTHGVLHLKLHMRGETIVRAIPGIGYLHRGVEKLAESLAYDQLAPVFERNDYLGPTANSLAFVIAVERMTETAVPQRGAWLRTLVAELQRLTSHLVWLGTLGLDLGGALGGGTTLYMVCFREREKLLDVLEALTGTRFHTNFNIIGGARYDLDPALVPEMRAAIDSLERSFEQFLSLTGKNAVFMARTRDVGVISKDLALGIGMTGPCLRGSGVSYDVRRAMPYDAYPELDFEIPTRPEGDAAARYEVRMDEMVQSVRIVRTILDRLPGGPIFSRKPLKNPKAMRVKAAEHYTAVESARGELGFYVISDGTNTPFRVKINAPSFCNLQCIPHVAPGSLMADAIATLGSLDPVLGDVDR